MPAQSAIFLDIVICIEIIQWHESNIYNPPMLSANNVRDKSAKYLLDIVWNVADNRIMGTASIVA